MRTREEIYNNILGGLGINKDKKKLILIAMEEYKNPGTSGIKWPEGFTPYMKAKTEYKGSKEYVEAFKALRQSGVQDRYIDNILMSAFDAGWNSK